MADLRVIVADDERWARAHLVSLLESLHPEVEVVAEVDCGNALVLALTHAPADIIFLDVQMPGGDGFTLFDRIPDPPSVIFVSAHPEHAVRAFEVDAVHYLTKPVSPARLADSLRRVSVTQPPDEDDHGPEREFLPHDRKVALSTSGGMKFVAPREIAYIVASDTGTEVHLDPGHVVETQVLLKTWEEHLCPETFARVHRSMLANVERIDRITRDERGGGYVHLQGYQAPLPLSRRFARQFRRSARELR